MAYYSKLENETLIKVTGDEKVTFLQGQLTQDIKTINQDQGALSAYCNPKGRIISLFEIFEYDNALYLSMTDQAADVTLDTIKKYAMFSKVTLEKSEDSCETYALWGKEADNIIKSLFGQPLRDKYQTISNDTSVAIKLPTKIPSYKIFVTKPLTINDATLLDLSNWYHFLIDNQYPVICAQTSEKFLPAELSLNELGAVSLSKGCFVGQEVIARMFYLGQTKKTLVKANYHHQGSVQLLDKIIDDKQKNIGEVVNATFDENTQSYYLLALINQSTLSSSNEITLFLNDDELKISSSI
ncbi:hypothetical protein L3V86_08130 [Thiotrichales bacterium 19S11-10]|nr:hypothetical protein [Thiotrichales bacterium 19S11-10]